jgi:hypothetical protein
VRAVSSRERVAVILRTLDADRSDDRARQAHSPGVDGNRRMTAMLGAVLLLLLAVEGGTIPFLSSLEPIHVLVGLVLLPIVLLKIGTTFYRFAGYYARRPAYRAAGPPHPAMRALGPVVVSLTLVLFASGVALAVIGKRSSTVYEIHKISFIAWFVVMTIHVVGHLWSVASVAPRDWTARARTDSWRLRLSAIAGATVAGCLLAAAAYPLLPRWGYG